MHLGAINFRPRFSFIQLGVFNQATAPIQACKADKTGTLPVAAYSATLMTITEGKCYSETELRHLLIRAGFNNVQYRPTAADRSVITARKGKR